MTTTQVVETSVTVNNNSPIQDYVHPDDQTQPFISYSLYFFIAKYFINLLNLQSSQQILKTMLMQSWGQTWCHRLYENGELWRFQKQRQPRRLQEIPSLAFLAKTDNTLPHLVILIPSRTTLIYVNFKMAIN